MRLTSQSPPAPASAADAAAMVQAGLGWLAADAGSLTAAEQADTLRALSRAESMHTAAHARVLAAFRAQDGYRDDGHGSARTWLRWQTRITGGAATEATGWMRRLAAHPAVAEALAGGEISPSWARQLCKWSDLLPAEARRDADAVLLGAAAAGWELADLGALAEELQRRCARPDTDPDDGFSDRSLRLETTFGGAGKLDGDLTPQCTAALSAVLEALGKPAGPEDLRSTWQRRHDALEEACRRLIAACGLPERAGQPTQIVLHMDLDRLRGLPGAPDAEAAWAGAATAPPGAECDAALVPVVTGRVDPDVLDRLASVLLQHATTQPGPATPPSEPSSAADEARQVRALRAARRIVLADAADLLSGPAGLAAYLRTRLAPGTVASVSLPLDIGAITETIPVHLRRAVAVRDRHCRFPGCDQPVAACQPHHIIPRSQGGPTCLTNLLTLCSFHHLIAVHRWGWGIALHPDGTVTATSPDGSHTLHSHGPPPVQAA
jgi:Domain of unknown function (DUF222)/HNH endonuclease